jgi:hypothetical protein
MNASSIGGDPKKGFLVSGISGGGNLTLSCTYRGRDDGLQPPLTGLVLMCTGPPHDALNSRSHQSIDLFSGKLPSWDEFEHHGISGRKVNQAYGGEFEQPVNPTGN